jgi:hypothetical protein
MAETHEVHHPQLRKWLLLLIAAFVVLIVMALSIQRPQSLTGIPLIGPSATPTPIASENIIITAPLADDNIGQRFEVRGTARVFENVVTIRLKEKLSGRVIGETNAYADAPDTGQFGDFTAGIELSDTSLRAGTEFVLEVFQYSAKDGSEIDKVSIPLTFTPTAE